MGQEHKLAKKLKLKKDTCGRHKNLILKEV